jgi:hypothetical protein
MKYIKGKLLFIILILPFFTKAQTRDNAGLQGSDGAVSGFFQTEYPVNYPTGAVSWWHFLDVRHVNPANNYAMQFAGSFFDQDLFFRKTVNNPSQLWSKVILERDGKVGIGTNTPIVALQVNGTSIISNSEGTNYNENLRLPSSNAGYACVSLGAVEGTSGTGFGQWSLIKFPSGQDSKFAIRHNNDDHFTVLTGGNVGIGTDAPKEKLSVNGKIRAHEIKVETANWPDYVFAKDYKLPSLSETEKHIKEKGHLPGIPSGSEVKTNGIDLGEMNAKLLQKLEEVILHLIRQEKEIEKLKEELKKK